MCVLHIKTYQVRCAVLAKGEKMRYAQISHKSQRKGRAAFPSIFASGDDVRKSARLFRFPVSTVEVYSRIHLHGGCVFTSSLTNRGSGIRKDPAVSFDTVRDPGPSPWAFSQKIQRRHHAYI